LVRLSFCLYILADSPAQQPHALNLRQLQSLCAIVDCGLRISAAARTLHRTQPSLTRQLKDIEQELGLRIFVRNKNRIIETTPEGKEVLAIARRILQDTASLRHLGQDQQGNAHGELRLVTTHTHARYTLPRIIKRFMTENPKVRLNLRQGDPVQCLELVDRGQADLALCGDVRNCPDDIVRLPCYRMNRGIITPSRHPLLSKRPIALEDVARFPIITYDESFGGRRTVDKAFGQVGLTPTVVINAADADVGKAYVQMNIGVAILPTIVFNARKDAGLRCIDARHLFPSTMLSFALRRNVYLRGYILSFIQMFAPALSKLEIVSSVSGRAHGAAGIDLPDL
jgi:LysR family cys regulon transcriptional activator